ncbi:MAG: hypothetical protein WCJ70_00200 [bacterium]
MRIIVPSYFSKRDFLWLVIVLFVGLIFVVVVDSYRASQSDRLTADDTMVPVMINSFDTKILDRLKEMEK